MATQTSSSSNSKSNNNNQYKTTTTFGRVGLTGDDFVATATAVFALAAKNREAQSADFQAALNFQQGTFSQLVSATQALNPGDPRKWLPFVGIGAGRSPISSALRMRAWRQNENWLMREFSRMAIATADRNGRLSSTSTPDSSGKP